MDKTVNNALSKRAINNRYDVERKRDNTQRIKKNAVIKKLSSKFNEDD
jgi:hypothetical protein